MNNASINVIFNVRLFKASCYFLRAPFYTFKCVVLFLKFVDDFLRTPRRISESERLRQKFPKIKKKSTIIPKIRTKKISPFFLNTKLL